MIIIFPLRHLKSKKRRRNLSLPHGILLKYFDVREIRISILAGNTPGTCSSLIIDIQRIKWGIAEAESNCSHQSVPGLAKNSLSVY